MAYTINLTKTSFAELLLSAPYTSSKAPYQCLQKPMDILYTDFSLFDIPYESIKGHYTSLENDYKSIYLDYEFLNTPYKSLEEGYDSIL